MKTNAAALLDAALVAIAAAQAAPGDDRLALRARRAKIAYQSATGRPFPRAY